MLKRTIWVVMAAFLVVWHLLAGSVAAIELTEEARTIQYNEEGKTVTYSVATLQKGDRLFDSVCAQCHVGGITKTNPNINLRKDVLNYAEPPRDNVVALIDYMEHPTTYDGEMELTEYHPCTERADLWPEMRNLSDSDLEAIAAHTLFQANVRSDIWGRGKAYN